MSAQMLNAALEYFDMGLSVIPTEPKGKRPAIDWERYMYERAERDEVLKWFGNGHENNVGIVHGAVSNNYIVIDVDGDSGIFMKMREAFSEMFSGRYIISGSRRGYHVPLWLGELPNFGTTERDGVVRPIGSRAWKTEFGSVNIRSQFCQSLAPPSVHPSGQTYDLMQGGSITWLPNLDDFILWVAQFEVQTENLKKNAKLRGQLQESGTQLSGDLLTRVLTVWDTIGIIDYFGLNHSGTKPERTGETRYLKNGGLLVKPDNLQWYCFEAQQGGGPVEMWAWQREGHYNHAHFRKYIVEMAWAAGLDLEALLVRSDWKYLRGIEREGGDRNRWTKRYSELLPQPAALA